MSRTGAMSITTMQSMWQRRTCTPTRDKRMEHVRKTMLTSVTVAIACFIFCMLLELCVVVARFAGAANLSRGYWCSKFGARTRVD